MKFISNAPEQQNRLVLVILLALFGGGLTLRLLNLSYFLLLIIALVALFNSSSVRTPFREIYRAFKPLHWAMASLTVALILSQALHGYIDLSPFNPIARLATFVLLLWLILGLTTIQMRALNWAWMIGIVLCVVQLRLGTYVEGRPDIENWYVALASLLGVFSVLSLGWIDKPGKLTVAAHVLGGICGLYVVYICQTRGVWIAIPLFMLSGYLTFVADPLKPKKIAMFMTGIVVFGVLFFNTDVARNRIQQAQHDIQEFSVDRNADTSVGTRFQLWEASWIMIKEHPFIGVGTGDHYKATLLEMTNRGVLPAYYNGAHSHNEVLFCTATMGIPGFIAILLTYFVPGYFFARRLLDQDRQIRAAAAMGICVSAGYMIFGLVDVLFKYKETEVFYCVACALFVAFISNRKKQLQATQSIANN